MESEVGNLWVAYLPLWLELKGRDESEGWAVEDTNGVVKGDGVNGISIFSVKVEVTAENRLASGDDSRGTWGAYIGGDSRAGSG